MNTLDFKMWLSEVGTLPNPADNNDPAIKTANNNANNAARLAVMKKKDPLKAAQQAVLNSNLPANKLGKVLPKDPDDVDM